MRPARTRSMIDVLLDALERRSRRQPPTESAPAEPAGSDIALTLARDQLSGVDSDDVKTLGYLGVDIAAAIGVVAVHGSLDRFWAAYVAGFALAAVLAIITLQRRVFYSGPDPLEVYFDSSPSPRLDVINSLLAARDEIKKRRRERRAVYLASVGTLIVTALGTVAANLGVR